MQLASAFGAACVAFAAVSAVPTTHDEIEVNSAQGLRLLSLKEGADPVWKTEDEKLKLSRAGAQFFDVTNTWEYRQSRISALAAALRPLVTFPAPSKTSLIAPLAAQLSITRMNTYLTNLTAFNRYYTSTGAAPSTYILNLFSSFATNGVGVSLFDHSWRQSSIIAKIPGTVAQTPVTILGAHMDSVNLSSSSSGLGGLRVRGYVVPLCCFQSDEALKGGTTAMARGR
ncbi:Peptide hydrolase [Mycena venus]|uniref:Peptide hydrolase n=1 Tax=Mycena venus TaxID=2733690 RepID=A0A8H6YZ18_9AGAR|nr:Peptide hydrolase [Mycena venus]